MQATSSKNRRPRCLILTYHSISAGNSPLCVSPGLFVEQIKWLAANAQVISLADAVAVLESRRPLPDRSVVLTFDDAFEDFFSQAAPVLREAKMPATVFVPTAYCGLTNRWPGQPNWVVEQPIMTWDQVRQLAHEGLFCFGGHSVTHPKLTEIPLADVEQELAGSKRHLEERTGAAIDFFCYPYGNCNSSVRQVAARLYRAACSTQTGMLDASQDPLLLPRVDAHLVRERAVFQRMFSPGFRLYLSLRRKVRQVRGFEPSVN